MRKKFLAALLSVVTTVGALSGCQSGASSGEVATEPEEVQQDGVPEEAASDGEMESGNFNLDGTLPIVKDAGEMEPIKIAIVLPPESLWGPR